MIGIGAGATTHGQVLVFHDLLGINTGHVARFVKRYGAIHEAMVAGVSDYAREVRNGAFPDESHTYSIDPAELTDCGVTWRRSRWPGLLPGIGRGVLRSQRRRVPPCTPSQRAAD